MLLQLNNEILDCELHRAQEAINFVDKKIDEISSHIKKSRSRTPEYLYDNGEYYFGLGFSIFQRHLTETLCGLQVSKKEALKLGHKHSSGYTFVEIINSSANWWKHEAEWHSNNKKANPSKQTIDIVLAIAPNAEWPLSNVLFTISSTSRFKELFPYLEEWNRQIINASSTYNSHKEKVFFGS